MFKKRSIYSAHKIHYYNI